MNEAALAKRCKRQESVGPLAPRCRASWIEDETCGAALSLPLGFQKSLSRALS
jgi:hypothetical protein